MIEVTRKTIFDVWLSSRECLLMASELVNYNRNLLERLTQLGLTRSSRCHLQVNEAEWGQIMTAAEELNIELKRQWIPEEWNGFPTIRAVELTAEEAS